jgi:hypothetical protein
MIRTGRLLGRCKRCNICRSTQSGDEGQGWYSVSTIQQQPSVDHGTITGVVRTTCNTALTQNVTPNPTAAPGPLTVTVASSTGCRVNDWVVVSQQLQSGNMNMEAVQLTRVGSGTITGVFKYNHASGDTITPALVLRTSLSGNPGQGRVKFLEK